MSTKLNFLRKRLVNALDMLEMKDLLYLQMHLDQTEFPDEHLVRLIPSIMTYKQDMRSNQNIYLLGLCPGVGVSTFKETLSKNFIMAKEVTAPEQMIQGFPYFKPVLDKRGLFLILFQHIDELNKLKRPEWIDVIGDHNFVLVHTKADLMWTPAVSELEKKVLQIFGREKKVFLISPKLPHEFQFNDLMATLKG